MLLNIFLNIRLSTSVFGYMTAEGWYIGILLPFIVALVTTEWMHPLIVRMARERHLTDNPDWRKLQKEPVPVLGGMAVFFGIVIGAGAVSVFFNSPRLFVFVIALTVMMYSGMLDDMIGLSPWTRIFLELLTIVFVVQMDGTSINDLHGVFGIHRLPVAFTVLLTMISCVGIINAINLIDGVNGLSSGYCFVASICFGFVFAASRDTPMAVMAFLAAGALLPFWFHNVFGVTTKMFIGDSGTLMMGMLMSIFCLHAIDSDSLIVKFHPNVGVVAFCLSVLSVPVFDCIRVMSCRIRKGISPFHADKSHLHHLFLRMGCSHLGAAFYVVSLDVLNILYWLIAYLLGAGPTVQLLVVIVTGIISTFGICHVAYNLPKKSWMFRMFRLACLSTHWERGKVFKAVSRFVDRH